MQHVYPVSEFAKHELQGTMCPCGARLELHNGEMILVHNRLANPGERHRPEVAQRQQCASAPEQDAPLRKADFFFLMLMYLHGVGLGVLIGSHLIK